MQFACKYADCVKTLQIRNVPNELHRQLKSRAALAGQSLSEYALAELRRSAERPTHDELVERIRSRARVSVVDEPADLVRAERDSR